jgi:hypothetical protein
MPSWELDPALFLASQSMAQAPAEELACVICTNPARLDQPRTIWVVDVDPTSRSYSEVVGKIALAQADERPHLLNSEKISIAGSGIVARGEDPDPGRQITPRALLAHNPSHPYGFASSGFSRHNLSSAISVWYRDGGPAESRPWPLLKVIQIPAEPDVAEQLPALLRLTGAVPPLIADIALSPDDRFLYVACWGTGELKQFDVSDPLFPREIASVRVGGIAARAAHPSQVRHLNGGPGLVTVSRDGRRIYLTNSLSPAWDEEIYPDGFQGWMVKLDADPGGGITFDPNFFVDFGDQRPQEVRLQGQGLG